MDEIDRQLKAAGRLARKQNRRLKIRRFFYVYGRDLWQCALVLAGWVVLETVLAITDMPWPIRLAFAFTYALISDPIRRLVKNAPLRRRAADAWDNGGSERGIDE